MQTQQSTPCCQLNELTGHTCIFDATAALGAEAFQKHEACIRGVGKRRLRRGMLSWDSRDDAGSYRQRKGIHCIVRLVGAEVQKLSARVDFVHQVT